MDSCLGLLKVKDVSKKKTKEMFDELLIEILIRLPVNSLMRFKCVSKLWLSLISSRYLTNLFLNTSPRSRFYVYLVDQEKQSQYVLLTSSNSYHHSDTSVEYIRIDHNLTTPPIGGGYFVSSVRGLTCFRNGRRVQICNVNTRQVVELPIIKGNYNEKNVWSYFGYEYVNDEYKVLSTAWEVSEDEEKVVKSEHHVLSLGPGASWKKTQNHIHHRPYSEGITVNNVLYYEAWTDAKRCVLMSFDFRSEEFKLIEFPFKNFFCFDFMNYKGKVAVLRYIDVLNNGTVEFWVLEEDSWSNKKTFVLPVSQMNFHGDRFTMGGYRSRSGQIWLRKSITHRNQPISFLIYDMERNEIVRRIETRTWLHLLGSFKGSKSCVSSFWDDIESIMYLEI